MKKLFGLLLVTVICFLAVPVCISATLPTQTTDDTQGIDLNENSTSGSQRSLINPIKVFVAGACVEVYFNASLGNLSLSIEDESGNVVYWQSVITYSGQLIFVDISSFNTGEYTIELVNLQGQYLEGSFRIE